MNCIYIKKRTKQKRHYVYCNKLNKEITFNECRNCIYKEYKIKEYSKMKNKSSKQVKKEKERFSIIYTDLTICCNCGSKRGHIDKNEIFEGSHRQISMKLGMVAPFCEKCHRQFHEDIIFNLSYKVIFEKEYLKTHTKEEFIKTFGQDYIFKLKQKKNLV